MPTVGIFHTNYWAQSIDVPIRKTFGGYPMWQTAAVTLGSGFGGMLPFWERAVDRVKWTWFVLRHTWRYDPERRAAVVKVLHGLEHDAFPVAQKAVRKTATTLGFNRPEAWKELSRELKGDPGKAENAFRHLEAARLVRANYLGDPLPNPVLALTVELAYQAYAWRGK